MTRSFLTYVLLLGLVCCPQQTFSQETHDWEAWRQGRNIAGLSALSSPRAMIAGKTAASSAELFGSYISGGFHGGSEAQELWQAGAKVETEVHLPSWLLTGNLSFAHQSGDKMCGSLFTQPGYFPFDVLEFTPGRKTLRTYAAGGGLAWQSDSPWILGGTLRFEGANSNKHNGFRHTANRLDLEVVPSVLFDQYDWRIGASYIFRLTAESLKAGQAGSGDAVFLDKGMMYGAYQAWDGTAREFSHGFAVQGELGNFLYGDAEWLFSRGTAGEMFRFPGRTFSARLIYTLHRPAGVHSFRLGYDRTRQELDAEASDKIYERLGFSVGPSWRFYRENGMEFGARFSIIYGKDLGTLLPSFLDHDESTAGEFEADAVLPLGRFQLSAGVLFGRLFGDHRHVIEKEGDSPFRLEDWWDREQEVSDATRLGGSLAIRYDIPLRSVNGLFLKASCACVHAFGIELLPGADRQETLLTLGYDF